MNFHPLLLLGLAGCMPGRPGIEVRDAYSFAPVSGQVGALYFTIENRSGVSDTLLDVEVAGASVAMLHEQVATGEMVEMRHVGRLAVAPRSTVTLAPGGLHVMMEGMSAVPAAGDTLQVTARFAHAGSQRFKAPVVPYGTSR